MKIIREDCNITVVEKTKPGDCILLNGNTYIVTTDNEYNAVKCVNLINGTYENIDFGDIVYKVDATLTVEG